ncbi:proline-rich protein 36-like [Panicum virgatum]|uniref:proline-rich protein 36-like n=1 Tax=Panicum virgatum TaxID=38727 RepID=UPI0019D5E717|nr:proline-rich protein 36-like [Panicum virgatum]
MSARSCVRRRGWIRPSTRALGRPVLSPSTADSPLLPDGSSPPRAPCLSAATEPEVELRPTSSISSAPESRPPPTREQAVPPRRCPHATSARSLSRARDAPPLAHRSRAPLTGLCALDAGATASLSPRSDNVLPCARRPHRRHRLPLATLGQRPPLRPARRPARAPTSRRARRRGLPYAGRADRLERRPLAALDGVASPAPGARTGSCASLSPRSTARRRATLTLLGCTPPLLDARFAARPSRIPFGAHLWKFRP